jgi:hypothetical protein
MQKLLQLVSVVFERICFKHFHMFVLNFFRYCCFCYSVTIVPETGSTVLRQIVEALFITHAETELNSSGRLVGNNNNANKNDDVPIHENAVWCEGLVRRPLPSIVKTMTTIDNTAPSK